MSIFKTLKRGKGDPKVISKGPSSLSSSDRLARNLGWFSIGSVWSNCSGRAADPRARHGRPGDDGAGLWSARDRLGHDDAVGRQGGGAGQPSRRRRDRLS